MQLSAELTKRITNETKEKAIILPSETNSTQNLAYWCFRDDYGRPLALVGMLYEKKEVEKAKLWNFMKEIGTTYIVLFILAAGIAFLITRDFTKSLSKLSESINHLKLGKKNEPLEWKSNDEIGQLIQEYNSMLFQLEASADKLAQQERETAWREMAQQIAHDIKNPLTPMRLRVQHLKRQFDNEDKAQFQSHLLVFIQTMTEQIDALANIANTFSQLARAETLEMEKISPEIFFQSLTTFYKDEDCSIDVFISNPNVSISANHNALHRIATNLITNAIQAKKDGVNMHIDINIGQHFGKVFVVIQDNGQGIPESMMGQLFQPKFTTKKTGSGLGLATAKALMEKMNGQILCKSRDQKGTRFYLIFPIVEGA
jgi:nitrogen fixation/metabolism regulation signal transduction histidine kinase